jgi:crotonobetainyl-CoA:carnitine CoA-transferase CaiB-like acyl-CoA transferase
MFEDLVVFDLSTVLAGPSVATFFAELGAQVTKIEHPEIPDVTRSWRIPGEDQEITSYFASINYRKKYIQKDWSNPTDNQWLFDQLPKVDVLLMNFKSMDYDKFNFTKEKLLAINPRLIIGSISGFGDDTARVAYDLILQAESGFMGINGEPGNPPLKMPVALIDVLAAHHLKEGLLLALMQRKQTGEGSWVSVSLYDAAVCSLVNQASAYLMNDLVPKRLGSLHPNIAPYGELFETKDGKTVTFAIGSNRQFELLCKALGGEPLLLDDRYAENVNRVSNRTALAAALVPLVQQIDCGVLVKLTRERGIPMGVIRSIDEVLDAADSQHLIRSEQIATSATKRLTQLVFKWK